MTIDIAKLRELLQAATRGPYEARDVAVYGEGNTAVCDCSFETKLSGETLEAARTDAQLICAAVNALPELLAVYEAACACADSGTPMTYADLRDAVDAARKAGT